MKIKGTFATNEDIYAIFHQYTKLNLLIAHTNFLLQCPSHIKTLTKEQKENLIKEILSSKELIESIESIEPSNKKDILEKFNQLLSMLKSNL